MNQYFKQKIGGRGTQRQLNKVISPVEQESEVFRETLESLGRIKIENTGVEASYTGHTSRNLEL